MTSNEEKHLTGSGGGGDGSQIESPVPPTILRGLGDRSYDKRKNAALELTALIRTLHENNEKERIVEVLNVLSKEFVRSRNSNHRKGGLIGVAACAIGFMQDVHRYLHILLPPVLECFDDQESRVCYYACEALYNIAKVSRNSILRYFNQIFDGLCKLFAHVDVDVKNGANLLDRLIKDIVTESEAFDLEAFIPLLQKHIKRTKPYIRQLLVGWISILNSVPDISMLDYLPEFLDGLFNMLSDGNREIRQGADNVLSDFLQEIKATEVVEFGPMVLILVGQSRSKEKFNRLTSIVWLHEFVSLGGAQLVEFFAPILGSIMYCISDQENEIRVAAKDANQSLLNLVKTTTKEFELGPLLRTLTMELLSPQVTTRVASLSWINMLHEKDPLEMNKFITDLLPALLKTLSDSADEVVLINLQVLARICIDEYQFQRVLNALVQLFSHDRPLLEARGALIIRKLCNLLNSQKIFISLASIMSKTDPEFSSTMVQTLNLILLTAPELSPLRNTLENSIRGGSEENQQVFITLFKCWSHNPVATFSLCLLSQAYDLSAELILKFAYVDVTIGFLMQIDKLVQLLESPIFLQLRLQLLEVSMNYHSDLLKSLYGLLMLLPQSQAYKTLSDRLSTVSSLKMNLIFPSTGEEDFNDLLSNDYNEGREGGGGGGRGEGEEKGKENRKEKGEDKYHIRSIAINEKENGEEEEGGGGGGDLRNSSSIDYPTLLLHFKDIQLKHSEYRLNSYEQKKIVTGK